MIIAFIIIIVLYLIGMICVLSKKIDSLMPSIIALSGVCVSIVALIIYILVERL